MCDSDIRTIMEIAIPSRLGSEKLAMEAAALVAKRMGFHNARISDLRLAIAEACTNAIEYGNAMNEEMKVVVVFTMRDDKLEVNIEDSGAKGTRPRLVAEIPDIDKKVAGLDRPRGWGMYLIENLMDEVEITTTPEGGNQMKMVIHLSSDAGEEGENVDDQQEEE